MSESLGTCLIRHLAHYLGDFLHAPTIVFFPCVHIIAIRSLIFSRSRIFISSNLLVIFSKAFSLGMTISSRLKNIAIWYSIANPAHVSMSNGI